MPTHDLFRRATGMLRRTILFTCVIASSGLAACSDDGDGGDDEDDITGTWALDGGGTVFLDITSSTLTVYEQAVDCFARIEFDIVAVDGDAYTLEADGGFELTVEINRSGDNLVINGLGDEEVYQPSSVDVTDLEVCGDDLGTPDFGSCASLPTFDGGVANGTLGPADLSSNGFFYDAYRLDVAATTTYVIELQSDEIDPYLYLYNSGGALIASNDDFGAGFDSAIEITLNAGCYIVAASSYDYGEVGSYTVFVNSI